MAIVTLLALLFNCTPALAYKFKVLPKNRALSLFLIEWRFTSDLISPREAVSHFADLKGEALACWYLANPTYRQFFSFNLDGVPLVLVLDIEPDRGSVCYYYFNPSGEYLNSWCGSPDRRWTWNN